ncbi:glyoxal oxidase-related protein [Forsythia ovata]|uniref:Glyoxal oxidase-related protein n=1 Tax=Forsythia ovata TaxID=205694 RepID=A0ABD1TQU0_9LAMI
MDNLYPYVHLLSTGQLFIFANTKAVLYNQNTNIVVNNYPILDGGPRNYPSVGSSVMLPLTGPTRFGKWRTCHFRRIMGDMVILSAGDVLIINGAQARPQGIEMASQPCMFPAQCRPSEPICMRFMTLNPSSFPRMYHSTKNLLPDSLLCLVKYPLPPNHYQCRNSPLASSWHTRTIEWPTKSHQSVRFLGFSAVSIKSASKVKRKKS